MDPVSPDYLQIPLSKKTLLLTVLFLALLVSGFVVVKNRVDRVKEEQKLVALDKASTGMKRILNEKTKSGVFTIKNNTTFPVEASSSKQLILDGVYNKQTGLVENIQATVTESLRELHEPPPRFGNGFVVLTIDMKSDRDTYNTSVSLELQDSGNTVPFRLQLPYYASFELLIHNDTLNKLSLRKKFNL